MALQFEVNVFTELLERSEIVKIDELSGVTYYGFALSTTDATSSPVWNIWRGTKTGTIRTLLGATGLYNQIWDDRATLFGAFGFLNTASTLFDGVNDYINFGDNHNFDNATQWSFSAWVRPNNFSFQHTIWAKVSNDASVLGWGFYTNTSGQIFIQMRALGQLRSITGSASLNALAWCHVAVTYSGNQNSNGVKIYIDGVLDVTGGSGNVTNTLITTDPSQVGRRNSAFPYPGHIDEVSFWSVELNSTEVAAVYNSGIPDNLLEHTQVANLDHWYRMGDFDTIPIVLDQIVSIDGTMINGPIFSAEVPV